MNTNALYQRPIDDYAGPIRSVPDISYWQPLAKAHLGLRRRLIRCCPPVQPFRCLAHGRSSLTAGDQAPGRLSTTATPARGRVPAPLRTRETALPRTRSGWG